MLRDEYLKARREGNDFKIVYTYFREHGGSLPPMKFNNIFQLYMGMGNAGVISNLKDFLDKEHSVNVLTDKTGKEIEIF